MCVDTSLCTFEIVRIAVALKNLQIKELIMAKKNYLIIILDDEVLEALYFTLYWMMQK